MFRAVLVIGMLAAACAAGQTSGQTPGQAKSWTPPHTPDGQPDLQGLWTNATLTPLERPTDLAGKQFLTEQEAKEFAKRALNDVDADRRDGGGVTDVNRAYNEFWRERGNVTADRRTSLIVDPPDGRVPALTAQAQKLVAARADAARTNGCLDAWKCFLACLFLEESQQPTCPHDRQRRRWTHLSPIFMHSSQPCLVVCLILIWSRCWQDSGIV